MSDILNEQLSALIDGELPPEETALLLKRLEREPELAARLARFRIYGEVMRGAGQVRSSDFGAALRERIALEPAHPARAPQSAPASLWTGWRSAVAGLSVAAGVAALALVVLHQLPWGADNPPVARRVPAAGADDAPVVAVAAAPAPVTSDRDDGTHAPDSYVTPAAPTRLAVMPAAELARYVVAHSEVSMPLSSRNVLIHLIADAPDETASTP